MIDTSEVLVEEFNRIYMTVMLENNIKVLSIHKDNPQYKSLREIAAQAQEFCKLFELDTQTGFLIYVRLGVKLAAKNYSLYRLKAAGDRIVNRYRSMLVVNNDPSPLNTNIMYETWRAVVKKYFSVDLDVKSEIDKYIHFVYAKQDPMLVKPIIVIG
jgi:hypothetical protein